MSVKSFKLIGLSVLKLSSGNERRKKKRKKRKKKKRKKKKKKNPYKTIKAFLPKCLNYKS